MLSDIAKRLLRVFDKIDEGEGSISRWEFDQLAGNTTNANRWEKKFCTDWKVLDKQEVGESVRYSKTQQGNLLHEALKQHEYMGDLFTEIGKNRLGSARWN